MPSNIKSAKQALNTAFLKQKPERKDIELFKKEFQNLLSKITENQSEAYNKKLISDFLENVYYREKYEINEYNDTKNKIRVDFAIKQKDKPSVEVLFEVKHPTNKTEMITRDNLNKKALQELLLYYMSERINNNNQFLRYFIVTNMYEWFVFDAKDFYELFFENKSFKNLCHQYFEDKLEGDKTKYFYEKIAAPEIEKLKNKIPFVYFDIRDYADTDDEKIISLYKFLSPNHLLKIHAAADANELNREFYAELLHILGLEEVKEGGQKFIVRKKADERDNGSLLENAIERIEAKGKLKNADENQLFETALDLTITWINRILFLKLLEAQIVKYNGSDKNHAFLSLEKLSGYNELDTLFFSVLAKKENERNDSVKTKFAKVPYLNSSLFELTETENNTICIDSLHDNIEMKLYPKSVLHGFPMTMKPLEYLLRFLDAYDFSGDSTGEEIRENSKTLVSASVLGLIFEKINGYKDGSFFTPSFITMYMCRETIERAVVQKFNEHFAVRAKNFSPLQTIADLYNKIDDIAEANTIFNSIRICDPAVGSGHFLVSALNEMVRLKSELGILVDKNGKRLKDYRITTENDELIITDYENNFFNYNPQSQESQRVQETLFHEKQTIIENCLFGVDINPNSVKICQLRLWIELLKHTYYKQDTKDLETLPNIDINIKTGNSLISRFGLHTDIKTALRQSKWNIDTYKIAVETYKNAENKEQKREIKELIDTIKTEFRVYVSRTTPLYIALEKARTELYNLTKPQLFNFTENELGEWTKKVEKLTAELTIREQQFEDYKTGKNLIHAFEWRFEFPEALDDDGDFAGFDVVIGNPPYIQLQSMGAITDSYKQMNYQVFERTGDIYCLFYELGHKLLKQNGLLSFITSNKWMRAGYGEKTRKFFVENTNPTLLVDFAGVKVFDEATVDVNILMLQKDKNRQQTQACIVKKNGIKDLSVFVRQQSVIAGFDPQSPESSWVILSPIEQRIKAKIEAVGVPLKDWDIQINYGIKTGFNDAFIISGEKRKELIAEDPKSAEIIRPLLRGRDIKRYGYQFADLHLITTFPSLKIDIEKYPAVKQHLMSFGYDRLKQTGEEGARKKTNNQWFETQDSISYCEDFFKQKIMYPNMTKFLPFYFDNQSFFQNDKSFMIVGENIAYLTAILNSSLFKYCFSNNFPELQGGTRELRKIFFDKIPILYVDKETNKLFESKIMKIQDLKMQNIETKDKEIEIDNMIFDLYHLTEEEKTIIGFIEIQ